MRATVLKRRAEEGASLVEFSLIAFLLSVTLMGVVEMGRMVLTFAALCEASHAGMRYAIVHGSDTGVATSCAPTSCTGVNTAVKNYASAGLINSSNVTTTVAFPDSSAVPGSHITVSVSYTYAPIVSYFSSALDVNLGSTSEGVIVF